MSPLKKATAEEPSIVGEASVVEKPSIAGDVSTARAPPARAPPADALPADALPADASPADATVASVKSIKIDNPNTLGVGCHKSNGLKHSTDVFGACQSITATNHRVAPNLLHKQVIVNESVALNLISKVTTTCSSDFDKINNIVSISTTFEIVVQDEIMKSNHGKVDGNATSFQPIGLNEKVFKSFGSYESMGLKLNYSCDCVVDEQNGTFFNLDKKIVTCSADGKAFNVVDDAAVQCIALTATLVLGNLSGAADGVAVAADLREINVLTILVRISCCVFFLSFSSLFLSLFLFAN